MSDLPRNRQLEGELSVNPDDFLPETLEDELRVDKLCQDLLLRFYYERLESGSEPAEATQWANSADYFIRDFVVGVKQKNLFTSIAGLVRQFAGNWYIMNTMEPVAEEITAHLSGIQEFYRYLHSHQLIDDAVLKGVEQECAAVDYYLHRIESFWNIKGDGYLEWEKECSLKS